MAVFSFSKKASWLACGEVTLKKDRRVLGVRRMVGYGGDSFSSMNVTSLKKASLGLSLLFIMCFDYVYIYVFICTKQQLRLFRLNFIQTIYRVQCDPVPMLCA